MKKLKSILVLICVILIHVKTISQVKTGDNTSSINSSSILELESTNKALIVTRVSSVNSITNPTNGMIVFDNSTSCIRTYNNGVWTNCNSGDETTQSIQSKRPLKTVNNNSLEGTGNIEIPFTIEKCTGGTTSTGTTETVSMWVKIPAGTVKDEYTLDIVSIANATGTSGNRILKIYINTSPNLSGTPFFIGANYGSGSANNNTMTHIPLQRFLRIEKAIGTTFQGTSSMNNTVFQTSEYGPQIGTNPTITHAINWNVDQYAIATVQCASATDSMTCRMIKIRR